MLTYVGFHLQRTRYISPHRWSSQRKPHAPSYPPGLWWYSTLSEEQSSRVIESYMKQRGKRGSDLLPDDFVGKLDWWLSELTTNQGTSRKPAYWTLKGYALDNRLRLHPFMAWFRKLEDVAKKLYPNRVPPGRTKPPLSKSEISDIRREYLKTGDAKEIAARRGIESWRVGQLCRKQKEIRIERGDTKEEPPAPLIG